MNESVDLTKPYMAEDVENTLKAKITGGAYSVGDKLPTEIELCESFGVSRTVIREAVAGLRSAGLVKSRRGSGVFVTSIQTDFPSENFFGGDWHLRVPDVIDALEFRITVEIQSVKLASERGSNSQIAEISRAHEAFCSKISEGENASGEDFDFHFAIARATNNTCFKNFLEEIGTRTIPRENLEVNAHSDARQAYLVQLAKEHEEIAEALEARDGERAAVAMSIHLSGSLARYRKLARNTNRS